MKPFYCACLFSFGAVLCASAVAPTQYTAYSLGPGVAYDINNSGLITATLGPLSLQRAFVGPVGSFVDLGAPAGRSSIAYRLNDNGTAVGTFRSPGSPVAYGFQYSAGAFTALNVPGNPTAAHAINSAGAIVGATDISGYSRAFHLANGVFTSLGTLGGDHSIATAINNSGTIVGLAYTSNHRQHAFSYSGGVMTDLVGPDGPTSAAQAINDAGVIVGYRFVPSVNNDQAFWYADGVMHGLGTLGGAFSLANDINSSGVIVGNADTYSHATHAFAYRDGVMLDLAPYLTAIGITGRSEALAINERGDIVGTGNDAVGNQIAYLLAVPEPSPLALGILAVFACAAFRPSRKAPVSVLTVASC